jgi:hypothetical protein
VFDVGPAEEVEPGVGLEWRDDGKLLVPLGHEFVIVGALGSGLVLPGLGRVVSGDLNWLRSKTIESK